MRKLIGYLREYLGKYYHKKLYLWVMAFLAISISLEYSFQFRKMYTRPFDDHPSLWPVMFLHHFIPYFFASVLIYFLGINKKFIRKKGFWLSCFIGFSLLGLDQSDFYNGFINHYFNGYELYFFRRVWGWANSLFIIVLPLIILNKMTEGGQSGNLYGIQLRKFDIKPYLILLLLTSLVLFAGSFWPDIHNYYPRYLHSYGIEFARESQIPQWIPIVIYESAYSSNFISVELFFRGFLIMAFSKYLGAYAVIPMVASYCFLHFGKPLGETISSIFGGYILGIISYYTRNIWGGILLHIGVALLMELFGYIQNLS